MWAYFDTSALVKRYVQERGSEQIRTLLRRYDFLSSAITPVEIVSALYRRRRENSLSAGVLAALLRRISSDRQQWRLVEVSSPVLDRAQELLRGSTPLRALDAIQIASLVTFQDIGAMRLPIVTADVRQREAATQIGIEVISIG